VVLHYPDNTKPPDIAIRYSAHT